MGKYFQPLKISKEASSKSERDLKGMEISSPRLKPPKI
jgi:hypothetical protein